MRLEGRTRGDRVTIADRLERDPVIRRALPDDLAVAGAPHHQLDGQSLDRCEHRLDHRVVRGGDERRVECEVVADPVERGRARLQAFEGDRKGREVIVVRVFGRERGRLRLEHEPGFRELPGGRAAAAILQVERLEPAGTRVTPDEGPATGFDIDQAAFDQ